MVAIAGDKCGDGSRQHVLQTYHPPDRWLVNGMVWPNVDELWIKP